MGEKPTPQTKQEREVAKARADGAADVKSFIADPLGTTSRAVSSASTTVAGALGISEAKAATKETEAATTETAEETEIDPTTNKKKEKGKGLDWKSLAGGGIFAILGYFLGQMFGAGPFGMIASLGLAVGGFFIGGDLGNKIFGSLFGGGKGSDTSTPAQGQQLAQSQQQGQAQQLAQGQQYGQGFGQQPEQGQYMNQPYGYAPNGLSPVQAQYLAQQSGFVPPEAYFAEGRGEWFGGGVREHRHHGLFSKIFTPNQHREEKWRDAQEAFAFQDVGQGYAPPAPIYYGAPPVGGISRISVQGRDVGVNFNNNGGFGIRARF